MISIQNIHKSFSGREILSGISLDIEKGQVIVILGPSGSGKTTFLRCLNALEMPEQGGISFPAAQRAHLRSQADSAALTVDFSQKPAKSDVLALRRRCGMVFQQYALFPHKTVLQNVMEGPVVVQKRPKKEVRESALALLAKVGLSDKVDAYPHQLSGGQQQRVGIARALAIEPELVLFDEPTSALDPELVQDVLKTIQQLAAEGWTMVLVTHELSFAMDVADKVIIMDEGVIVEEGSPQKLLTAPETERAKRFLSRIRY